MLTKRLFWPLLVSVGFQACASKAAEHSPAPASAAHDPLVELVEIPVELCPSLANYFAISADGMREILRQEIASETQHAVDMEKCRGVARLESARRENAETVLLHAQWWNRWGPILAASGTTAGLVLGLVGGFLIPHGR